MPLGDLTSEQMRVIGDLAAAYADGTVRVTMEQDLVFRWVKVADVHELYQRLAAAVGETKNFSSPAVKVETARS